MLTESLAGKVSTKAASSSWSRCLRFDRVVEEGYLFCRVTVRAAFHWLSVSTISLHPSLGERRAWRAIDRRGEKVVRRGFQITNKCGLVGDTSPVSAYAIERAPNDLIEQLWSPQSWSSTALRTWYGIGAAAPNAFPSLRTFGPSVPFLHRLLRLVTSNLYKGWSSRRGSWRASSTPTALSGTSASSTHHSHSGHYDSRPDSHRHGRSLEAPSVRDGTSS